MKKMIALMIALCMLLTCAVPASAEEETALPYEEPPYETIHYWDRLYVDYDAAICDAGILTEAVARSGLAEQVFPREGSSVYVGEDPAGTDSLLIVVRAPCRENSEALARLLEPLEGVSAVCHPMTGCADSETGDYFTFDHILTCIDLTRCGMETALRELRALPRVHYAVNTKAEDDDSPKAIVIVEVEVPADENGPAVLRAVREKDYVVFAQFDRLAIAASETEEDVRFFYGDVNRDGDVSAGDARQILRFSVRLDMPGNYLAQVLSDMDFDGSVTAADARLALRTAVGLHPKNYYTYSAPKYAGLIAGKSLELTKQGSRLLITASTTGSNAVTKCGFTYVKLQRLVNGVWTDMKEFTWRDQFNNTNSKVFSASVAVPKGSTCRVVCEHYAEAPYLQLFTQSASYYNATNAVAV